MADLSTREAYVERVRTGLRLPPDIESDVLEEIRGHIDDASDGLVAEGLDRDRAVREAIARLGAPDVLAEQIRSAHQTPRRALAAAAGGVWAAGRDGLYALIFGYVFLGVAMLLAACLSLVVASIGLRQATGLTAGTVTIGAFAWAFAAERAGRAATVAVAMGSRRRISAVAIPVAAVGSMALGLLVLTIQLTLDWIAVLAVLAIPAAFALGALRAREGEPRTWRPRRTWPALVAIAVAFAAATTVAGLAEPASTSPWEMSSLAERDAVYGFDRIGPDASSIDPALVTDSSVSTRDYEPVFASWAVDTTVASGWHDLRVELWRAAGDSGPIAADAIRPAATVPVTVSEGLIEMTIDPPRYRDLGPYWFVLTGVDASGNRFRLSDPDTGTTAFRGSVLDWFRAGDTPDR
jgi:uncharacterized membrane protein